MFKNKSTRRQIILSGLGAAAATALPASLSFAGGNTISPPYGGGGGGEFDMQFPKSIGLRYGKYIDALLLNGTRHGGTGGTSTGELPIEKDEYLDLFIVRHGSVVDGLYMTTNKGKLINGGGNGGTWARVSESPIRILLIGGRSGDLLDQIKIEYIDNYRPSVFVEEATFIIKMVTPAETYKEYSESSSRNMQTYSESMTVQNSLSVKASVEGEYFAKFASETEAKFSKTTVSSMQSLTEKTLKEFKGTTLKPESGTLAFLTARGNIMRDADGGYWMHPTRPGGWSVFTAGDYGNLRNHYDMTSNVHTQTGMQSVKKYGFDFLPG